MGSKQVCQHHKDHICLNSAFVQENNATLQDTWGWSSVLSAFRWERFTVWAVIEEGGRSSCSTLQKKPEGSGDSKASKEQFLMALGHEGDLLHACSDGS